MRNTPKVQHSNTFHEVGDAFKIKVGAVVTKYMEGAWYFGYFNSQTRPYRGSQIVRGNVDPGEDLQTAVVREIEEEYGRKAKVLEKLMLSHHYADSTLADIQLYYLAEDLEEATPDLTWQVIDGDEDAQLLEWQFARLDGDLSFMGRGQTSIVEAARRRLLS